MTIIHIYKGQKTTKNRKNNNEILKSLSSLSKVIILCLNSYLKKNYAETGKLIRFKWRVIKGQRTIYPKMFVSAYNNSIVLNFAKLMHQFITEWQ